MSDNTTMQKPTHLFFDEEGNTISAEEYRRSQGDTCSDDCHCEDDGVSFRTPLMKTRFTFNNPATLLMFFRFLDAYNEQAYPEDIYMLPAIPRRLIAKMIQHPDFQNPPLDWMEDAAELLRHLAGHMDLSS